MYSIKQIVGEDILTRYNEIKVELDKALEYSDGEWTAAQIVAKAISEPGMFHLWELTRDGEPIVIGSTRISEYNNFTSLHIMTLGGRDLYDDMPELTLELEKIIKKYEHIDFMEYTGRRGFIKQLSKIGWKEQYVVMRKNLKENLDV